MWAEMDDGKTYVFEAENMSRFWERHGMPAMSGWVSRKQEAQLLAQNISRTLRRNGPMDHHESIELTHRLLTEHGVSPRYHVSFSNRLTKAMGLTNYRVRSITYSIPLWARADTDRRRETVVHEAAHAIVEAQYGLKRGTSHGRPWRTQMRVMGYPNARPYHTVDRTGLRRERADTVEVSCCGEQLGRLTFKRLARILLNPRAKCRRCAEKPKITSVADQARFEAWVKRS